MWERCALCPSRNCKPDETLKYVVPGMGDEDAQVMLVGEAPGKQENNMHRPFVGKTGEELDGTYFPLCGYRRDSIYLTNAVKCHWADSSDAPPDWLVRSCSEFHLRRELAEVRPRLIVLMGGVAAGLAGLNVDMEHGFLTRGVRMLGWQGDVFVTYHPALGMHKSSGMLALLEDFKALRTLRELPVDQFPNPTFRLLETADAVRAELGDWHGDALAIDTESVKRWRGFRSTVTYTPWCATFCREPGYAYMVRVSDAGAWGEFGRQAVQFRRVLMHNADHDMMVLGMAGVRLEWGRVQDTMQLAYHDGRLAKGLKSLGYRLLGSRMRSYEDVVVPWGRDRAMEWLEQAVLVDWPAPVQTGTGEWEWKNCPDCQGKGEMTKRRYMLLLTEEKPEGLSNPNQKIRCKECKQGKVYRERFTRKQGVREKLNRLVGDLVKNKGLVDIWERWEGWSAEDIGSLVAKLGAIPVPSIDYAPLEEAIPYGCGDAHTTFRIAPILRKRVADIRRKVR